MSRIVSELLRIELTDKKPLQTKIIDKCPVKTPELVSHDAISHSFAFLDKKEIAMFKCVSKETKYVVNRYLLRYSYWIVKRRDDGVYVLKYIDNFDDMRNIDINTLTWHDKCDDTWYLLNDYWFDNRNFGWGTFERSNSVHKKNGEWRILNNKDVYDRAFYLNVNELNGIFGVLTNSAINKHFVKRNKYEVTRCNNCLRKPVNIIFDRRNNLESRIGFDNKLFVRERSLHCYTITYWNGAVGFKPTGIKISGNVICRNKTTKNNVTWVNKEILYCNFLTKIYYGNKLNWKLKRYNNDSCEYIEYSTNNTNLINQLECNYQSQKLHVFTSHDRDVLSLTFLDVNPKNSSKKRKYFKFRCFRNICGGLDMLQVSITKF